MIKPRVRASKKFLMTLAKKLDNIKSVEDHHKNNLIDDVRRDIYLEVGEDFPEPVVKIGTARMSAAAWDLWSALHPIPELDNDIEEGWTNVARHELTVGNHRLTEEEVLKIRELYSSGDLTLKELGKKFGVNAGTVLNIVGLRHESEGNVE